MMAALGAWALAPPAEARVERIECTLSAPCPGQAACLSRDVEVRFAIDLNQFALAFSPDEPPRKKITTVTVGSERFSAEPILMVGDVRGFWAETYEGTHLLTFSPGQDAVYSRPVNEKLTGRCEVLR